MDCTSPLWCKIFLALAILIGGSQGALLSYWKFDESNGDVAYDSVGGRHLNMVSVGVPAGPSGFTNDSKFGGSAFYFAGNYANVTIASNNFYDFSLSFWMKSSLSTTVGASLYEGQGIISCDDASYDWTVSIYNGRVYVGFQDSSTSYSLYAGKNVSDGEWHHVAVTKRYVTYTTWSIYVDIVLGGSYSIAGNSQRAVRPCSVGATLPQQLNAPYGGILDEMRLYGYALNTTEISRDYYGNATNPTPPFYYWSFDETEGNTAHEKYRGLNMSMQPFFKDNIGPYGFTTDSKFGGHAYSFTGVRLVGIKALVTLPSLSNLTFSFWMKSSQASVSGSFATTPAILNCDGASFDWTVFIVNGSAAVTMQDEDNIQRTVNSTQRVNDGAWHFVTIVRSVTPLGSLLSVYVDTTLKNQLFWSGTSDRIGRTCTIAGNNGNNYFYSGQLDEMRLYTHAQTQEEINADYQNFAVTTQSLTTQELTTQPLTTQPLTTQELTTQPLTTKELTTQPLTTQELTTGEVTTQPLSTSALTTNAKPATTQPLEESSESPEQRGSNGGAIAGGIIAVAVAVGAGVAAFFIVRRRRSRKDVGTEYVDAFDLRKSAVRPRSTELPSVGATLSTLRDIEIKQVLGRGNFGEVYLAEWQKTTLVALKKVLGTIDEVLQEASILSTLNHPNVIRYLGVYFDATSESLYMVMEYLSEGSLDNWIRRNVGKLTTEDLVRLGVDAAAGMRYLEEKGVIHRDLALRNLLLGKGGVLKVADFGLSRIASEGTYVVTTKDVKVPVKWTAPEAIAHNQYSHASDVWSFGVMLWELFSYGELPYNLMSNGEAMEAIKSGHRLGCPKSCPPQIYKLMLRCWQINPKDRPTFSQIHSELRPMNRLPSNTFSTAWRHSSPPNRPNPDAASHYNLSTEIARK